MPLTKIKSLGITDGTITGDDINSTFNLTGKTVTLPAGTGGKVLQVVQATDTTAFSSTNTSMTATSKIISITPSLSTSKIFFTFAYTCRKSTTTNNIFQDIFRKIGAGSYSALIGGRGFFQQAYGGTTNSDNPVTITYLDSPSTTSQVSYQLYLRNESAGGFEVSPDSLITVMTAWEIGA